MRFLAAIAIVALTGQLAIGQPTASELVKKFRTTIGAEDATASRPYLVRYRGEYYLYSTRDGRLQGEAFPFNGKTLGFPEKNNKHRKEIELKIGIVPLKMVEVLNGDTGWYQFNEGEALVMSKAEVTARVHRELHLEVFMGGVPFDSKVWKFTEPKGVQVGGEDAWMFEAKASAFEPLTLYFAKQSGLLLRLTTKTTDFAFLLAEKPKVESFTRDVYVRDWKRFGKRMLPAVFQEFRDGVLTLQVEPVDLSVPDTIPAKLFDAPPTKK